MMKKLRKFINNMMCKYFGHQFRVYAIEGDYITMKCNSCGCEQKESIWELT